MVFRFVTPTFGAETGTPILLGIEPPCAQAGTRQEVVLRGVRLSDIEEVNAPASRLKKSCRGVKSNFLSFLLEILRSVISFSRK